MGCFSLQDEVFRKYSSIKSWDAFYLSIYILENPTVYYKTFVRILGSIFFYLLYRYTVAKITLYVEFFLYFFL